MSIFKRRKKANLGDDELVSPKNTAEDEEKEPITGLYDDEDTPAVNKRYKAAASVTGILKFIVLAAFFGYFMVMTLAYSSEINIENFRYIIKDMNFRLPVSAEDYGEIYYISDLEHSFALYRGDFVSVGKSRLDIIDMAGKTVQSTELGYGRPRVEVSEKYLLIYDLSNNAFSVYSSFSPLYSETLDYPVSCAAINDNGYFLIVSKDAEYKSVVTVYNSDMKKVYHYKTNESYVYDVIFDNDGTFMLYSVSVRNGGFCSQIVAGDIKSEEKKILYERENTVFISAKRSEGSYVSVLSDDSVMFFDGGTLLSEYSYFPETCRRFETGDGHTAAVFSTGETGADSYLCVFNKNGEVIRTETATSDVQKLYLYGGCVYQLYTDRIRKTDLTTFKTYEHMTEHDVNALVFVNSEVVLLASPSRAYPVSVYDGFKEVNK